MIASPKTLEMHEWEIPSYKLDAFKAKIDHANRRLAKSGLDARFEVSYQEFEVKKNIARADHYVVSNHEPVYVYEPWIRATLTGPLTLKHGHFTFVACLVPEEAGITVHSAPGQELSGYSPRGDNECDHCRVARSRSRLYLLRDDRDGSIIQLGHSCIELYTGVSPNGLWALTFDEKLLTFTSNDLQGGFEPRHYGTSVDVVLAYAFVHSENGRAYVASGHYQEVSTVSKVRTSLFFDINKLKDAERTYFLTKASEASEHLADTDLIAAIKASVSETSEDSDYGRNLRVILAGEIVSGRNVGILASLVKVYARQQQIKAERKANSVVAGFIGQVGERVKNIAATAKIVVYQEGNWGTKTFLVAIADDGHTIVWKASKPLDIEAGQRFTIGAAIVKAHQTYNGIDQTVISRPAKFLTCAEKREAERVVTEVDGSGSGRSGP
ncbi:hypothetical protein [Mycobacterium simiae]|uniref:hypothetical protein n=1 Tax=Mycobacterium simiae TaxID=1784 RepID=UPI0021CDCEA8|nr:hypothetical protein [Mycobacterium simiae]